MVCGCSPHSGRCGFIVSLAKWLPVVFISVIVTWSYYAYLLHLILLTVETLWEQLLLLVLYHIFFILFVWSYYKTVFTPPGSVPHRFRLTDPEMERIETSDNAKLTLEQILVGKDLPCTMRSIQSEVRYCSECSHIKPDRSHHCSMCGHCVLKMDHHCPWVNNCVAFNNYKFFILFLGYALLYCVYVASSTLKYFLQFWTTSVAATSSGKFHVLFLFFVSAMFSLSLASLFFYHCYLVSRNATTLEAFRPPVFRGGVSDKFAFHLGKFNNFQEVFGDNRWTWFLPVFTSFGDGVTFPQRNQTDEEAGLLALGSPPSSGERYPSEEHVPMMLSSERERERGWGKTSFSSNTSDEDSQSRNGSVVMAGANQETNGSRDRIKKKVHPSELVSVKM